MDQRHLIQRVSRSFALTLLTLPAKQRHFVGLTYLLARYADTLADCGHFDSQERLAHLDRWENAILGRSDVGLETGALRGFSATELDLLGEGSQLIRTFRDFPQPFLSYAEDVLKTLISGMKWDLQTFNKSEGLVWGVKDLKTFDWYTYVIAGCVGTFWVRVFGLDERLECWAVSYGKGLQRINILRDVQEDLGRGRIYLPEEELRNRGIVGDRFWKCKEWSAWKQDYIRDTKNLLMDGARFCDALPKLSFRLRWASLMPLRIGLATLKLLENRLDEALPGSKISRRKVKRLAAEAIFDVIGMRRVAR